MLNFIRCLSVPSLVHSDCATAAVTPGTLGKPGLCPNRRRAPVLELLLLVWEIFCCLVFCCFVASAAPFLSRPGEHLTPVYNTWYNGTLSDLQLWMGRTFYFQGSHGKGGESWSGVTYSYSFRTREGQISYISFYLVFCRLFFPSPPLPQSVNLLCVFSSRKCSFFRGVFCFMSVQRKQEGDANCCQQKEKGTIPMLNVHRTDWSWGDVSR